jgi:DNA polymerase-3 subunit epsilon
VERAFLAPLLRPHAIGLPTRLVDTGVLWRLLCLARGRHDPGWRALGEVAEELGLPVHRPHEAAGDALTAAQAFLALATHLEGEGAGSVGGLVGARARLDGWRLQGALGLEPAEAPILARDL